ncbi:MAG: NnrU family protein [Methyloligellaceae bacterium]
MAVLIAGLIIFLGIHTLPMFQQFRLNLTKTIGTGRYKGLFSLCAAVGLALIIYGYGLARSETAGALYPLPDALRHLMMLLMLFALIFLFAAYLPGKIKATLKHPMLIGVKTWALAHLLVNSNLEDLLLFGGFLVWAVLAVISARRRERANPPAESSTPSIVYDFAAIAVGLAVYVVFLLWGHEFLIGMPLIN